MLVHLAAVVLAQTAVLEPQAQVDIISPQAESSVAELSAIVGTATPGLMVHVVLDGVELCTPIANGKGEWRCSLPPPPCSLAKGSHVVSVLVGELDAPLATALSNFDYAGFDTAFVVLDDARLTRAQTQMQLRGRASAGSVVAIELVPHGSGLPVAACTAKVGADESFECRVALDEGVNPKQLRAFFQLSSRCGVSVQSSQYLNL